MVQGCGVQTPAAAHTQSGPFRATPAPTLPAPVITPCLGWTFLLEQIHFGCLERDREGGSGNENCCVDFPSLRSNSLLLRLLLGALKSSDIYQGQIALHIYNCFRRNILVEDVGHGQIEEK